MTTARTKLGAVGEHHARLMLERKGFRFVEANWHAPSGEIDLVMLDGELLVFVEVKVRRGDRAGTAEESITRTKARRLLATGEWYVAERPQFAEHPWRIDLVAITIDGRGVVVRSRHVEDAVVAG
jgi:putative endonuclease